MLEIERGGAVPVPCRHCGAFIKARVEEGTFNLNCPSCRKVTVLTCRRRNSEWVITTAPDGAMTAKS